MRILLIEDSERVAEIDERRAALSLRGYAVSIAGDLKGATELFSSQTIDHVAIVDVGLPDGSGLD